MGIHVALDGAQQLGLVGRAIAGRWRACACQHAQGKAHAQGVGVARERGNVHGLQIGVLDRGIELGGISVLCTFQAVGDGAAHRFFSNGHGRPGAGLVALRPGARCKQRVRRVKLAFKSEHGSGFESRSSSSHGYFSRSIYADTVSRRAAGAGSAASAVVLPLKVSGRQALRQRYRPVASS